MDEPHRGALMLVRFIAATLIGFGVIQLSLSWLERSVHHASLQAVDFALPAILFLGGIVILIKAGALATWISNKLDE